MRLTQTGRKDGKGIHLVYNTRLHYDLHIRMQYELIILWVRWLFALHINKVFGVQRCHVNNMLSLSSYDRRIKFVQMLSEFGVFMLSAASPSRWQDTGNTDVLDPWFMTGTNLEIDESRA